MFDLNQLQKAISARLSNASFLLCGEEVRRWANGMFSNNIRSLAQGSGNYSAICNDRGQVQGFLHLHCLDEDRFLCTLDGISQEDFVQRFNMFMILDDIELEEHSNSLLYLCGEKANDILSTLGLPIPELHQIIELKNGWIASSLRFGEEGFDCILPETLLQTIEENAHSCTEEDMDALRIFNGRAGWPMDGSEKTMIHELAVNELCCSFNKGCYVGQEIINRIDVKGLINKKLHRLELKNLQDKVNIGDTIVYQDKAVGTISSMARVVESGQEKCIVLSVLRKTAWNAEELHTDKGTVVHHSSR